MIVFLSLFIYCQLARAFNKLMNTGILQKEEKMYGVPKIVWPQDFCQMKQCFSPY